MISVIGLGLGDIQTLSTEAIQAIKQADVIIASNRQIEFVADLVSKQTEHCQYPSPIENLQSLIEYYGDKNIAILASGDPLFFGIGAWLSRHIPLEKLHFYSNISSIQAAFARIKQPWQQAKIISLHGRPLISLRPQLRNHQWYAILTDANSHPKAIAKELHRHCFEQSKIWVCEALGTASEKSQAFSLDELLACSHDFHPLHITIVYTDGKGGILPEFPGIADSLFETGSLAGKGMITKKNIRLAALTMLQTQANDICWDLGAGCGGLAVEWAYWHLQSQIYAVEDHKERLNYLHINREKFGVVNNLHIIEATVPHSALSNLPRPDKIFIGGSRAFLAETLQQCWQHYLKPNGCIVIPCVTETTRYEVMKFIEEKQLNQQVDKIQISLSQTETLANKEILRPQLPVQLIKISKDKS